MNDSCSNIGFDDRWTCPACYADLDEKEEGRVTCQCGAKLLLTVEMVPESRATVVSDDDYDEY